jgi:hypothetical protein
MKMGIGTKMLKLGCLFAVGAIISLSCSINQGFSQNLNQTQTNVSQFTTYQNKDLGISFQYPSNWLEMNEDFKKQVPELTNQVFNGQNLTSNQKIIADTVPVVILIPTDKNETIGVTLVSYDFPNLISNDEFNNMTLKMIKAISPNATIIENTNTTISNNEANKGVIKIDEGPQRGLYTSITFFKGNKVIDLQLGPSNDESQSSLINKIIESIRIND